MYVLHSYVGSMENGKGWNDIRILFRKTLIINWGVGVASYRTPTISIHLESCETAQVVTLPVDGSGTITTLGFGFGPMNGCGVAVTLAVAMA